MPAKLPDGEARTERIHFNVKPSDEDRVWVKMPLGLLYLDPETDRTSWEKRVLAWYTEQVEEKERLDRLAKARG